MLVPIRVGNASAWPNGGDGARGVQRSALKPLLRGVPGLLPRGGGTPPAPAFPLGGTGKEDQIPCCRRPFCLVSEVHVCGPISRFTHAGVSRTADVLPVEDQLSGKSPGYTHSCRASIRT